LDIAEVRPDLNILRNAAHELRASLKFKQTLQVGLDLRFDILLTLQLKTVLRLGNILNGSSFRGNAKGFQLDSLLKVC
jgi:hypothetical protein